MAHAGKYAVTFNYYNHYIVKASFIAELLALDFNFYCVHVVPCWEKNIILITTEQCIFMENI